MTSINSFSIRNKKQYSTYNSFVRPSFFTGVGSIFNICGNYYKFKRFSSPQVADINAIENDWGVIGNDIYDSISNFNKINMK